MQEYKLYDTNFCKECDLLMLVSSYNPKRISIEIKQTKEDMEEKKQKLDKLIKDYSYNRIPYEVFDNCLKQLYVDKQIGENNPSLKEFDLEAAKKGKPVCTRDGRKARIICFDRKDNTPIVALIECVNHAEILQCVHNDGKCFHYDTSNNDLMMLPEKKEGWILLRKDGYTFDNEEVAKKNCTDEQFVAKVEWEE